MSQSIEILVLVVLQLFQICPEVVLKVYVVACTEMTKTKKIESLRAVHVVELSWASIVIIFSFKSLHLGFRALP